MSIEAYQAVWEHSKSKSSARTTLLALAEFASRHNDYTCEAGLDRLADMVNVSARQIQKNITELEKLGEIAIKVNRGRGNTNVYDLKPLLKHEPWFVIYQEENTNCGTQKHEPEFANSAEKTRTPVQENTNCGTENTNSSTRKHEPEFAQTILNPSEPLENHNNNGVGEVYKTYEREIGSLSQIISDQIDDAVSEFGGQYVIDAIGIAAKNNVRKWSYVDGILKRWRANGRHDSWKQPRASPAEKRNAGMVEIEPGVY